MDKKYLVPVAVGVTALILVIFAVVMFSTGSTEVGVGAGVAAAAALEAERRRRGRDKAIAELNQQATEARESKARLELLQDEADETMAKNEEKVKDTSLSDLVDEENKRT